MIDSHAHLNDKRFAQDLAEVIERAQEQGVKAIINVGYDLVSSYKAVEIAEHHECCFAVVGLHPHDAKAYSLDLMESVKALTKHKKVLALGETGLDYYYTFSSKEEQLKSFHAHMQAGVEYNLPVVIHSRDAAQDTLDVVRAYPKSSCLLHCYSGSREHAEEYTKLGHMLSFAGPVTFANAHKLRSVVESVSLDHMLLETDCPYLTPVPNRGRRNEPSYVSYVGEAIARIKGVSKEELFAVTAENTQRFFRFCLTEKDGLIL